MSFVRPELGVIDSHCHLSDLRWREHAKTIIKNATRTGITGFFTCGLGPEDWVEVQRMANYFSPTVLPSYGIHPYWAAAHDDEQCRSAMEGLINILNQGIALAECGLDYRPQWSESIQIKRQRWVFIEQLKLAKSCRKPVVLHSVRAHQDVLRMIKAHWSDDLPFIVHGFAKGAEVATDYLRLGGYLSVGTHLLRPHSNKLREAVKKMPLSRLLVESDAPDQKLESTEGAWNVPDVCCRLVAEIAEIHQVEFQVCRQQLYENVCQVYREEWSS